MYDSSVVAEDTVKYFIDEINEQKAKIGDYETLLADINIINQLVTEISALWTTTGGIQKVNDLNQNLEELNTNKLKELIQEINSTKVTYDKKMIQENM